MVTKCVYEELLNNGVLFKGQETCIKIKMCENMYRYHVLQFYGNVVPIFKNRRVKYVNNLNATCYRTSINKLCNPTFSFNYDHVVLKLFK